MSKIIKTVLLPLMVLLPLFMLASAVADNCADCKSFLQEVRDNDGDKTNLFAEKCAFEVKGWDVPETRKEVCGEVLSHLDNFWLHACCMYFETKDEGETMRDARGKLKVAAKALVFAEDADDHRIQIVCQVFGAECPTSENGPTAGSCPILGEALYAAVQGMSAAELPTKATTTTAFLELDSRMLRQSLHGKARALATAGRRAKVATQERAGAWLTTMGCQSPEEKLKENRAPIVALNQAIYNDNAPLTDYTTVESLIREAKDINMALDEGKYPALVQAAKKGDLKVVELILAIHTKVDVDIAPRRNKDQVTLPVTPLCMAVREGHLAIVKALLAAWGPNLGPNRPRDCNCPPTNYGLGNFQRCTPSETAAEIGREDIVAVLNAHFERTDVKTVNKV